MSTDLLKQIDDLVATKTFNLDALEGIKAIKDALKKTLEERDSLQRRHDNLYDANIRQSEEIERLVKTVDLRVQDIDRLKSGEAKAKEAVWEKLIAEAQANAYKDALYTVFKPSAVRETIQRQVAIAVDGNSGGSGTYPTAGWVSHNNPESEVITKEQL